MKILLKVGADVDQEVKGGTALFKAAHKGHQEVVDHLLAYKPSFYLLKVSTLCSTFYTGYFLLSFII